LPGVKTFDQFNPQGFKLGAHRWINIGIAAGNTVTRRFGQRSNAAHEGAANAKNMNMHDLNQKKIWADQSMAPVSRRSVLVNER
jgi:hypothetical protein